MHRLEPGLTQTLGRLVDHHQHLARTLRGVLGHWRHQTPTDRELVKPGLRQVRAPGRGDDAVIGAASGVSLAPIAQ